MLWRSGCAVAQYRSDSGAPNFLERLSMAAEEVEVTKIKFKNMPRKERLRIILDVKRRYKMICRLELILALAGLTLWVIISYFCYVLIGDNGIYISTVIAGIIYFWAYNMLWDKIVYPKMAQVLRV